VIHPAPPVDAKEPVVFKSLLIALLSFMPLAAAAQPSHGIAMHGEPALPAGYSHFPYANPEAPKGGKLSFGVVGAFNNLNSFILKGKRTTARGMWDPELGNLVVESLMARSRDEPFTMYGLLAETVEMDDNRTFIQFNLNPKAHWSDGQPVTPEDVMFTFELMRDKGRPPFSTRLKLVETMEKVGDHSVRFTFKPEADREFPLLLALSPVLPKHATKVEGFDQTTLTPPLGSGPYLVKTITPGEKIVFRRDPNYWGKDLPAKVGFDNFDEISIEYYLQENTLFEAFKKGLIDVFTEGSPKNWDLAYNFPAVQRGDVIKDVFQPRLPANTLAMTFNTRRPVFADLRVRKALTLAFDFEWLNRSLFEKAYRRTESFWQNSDLSSLGVPASQRELDLLGPAKVKVEPSLLDGSFRLPVSDGSGRDRKILKDAFTLLKEAGYHIDSGRMIGPDGKPLRFEILSQSLDQERIAIAYQRTLAALGIAVSIRTVEDAQYQERTQKFDFDMIFRTYAATLSPGLEQETRWGSAARDVEGSDNAAGAADPDIDRMIGVILAARTDEDFKASVRAFDRLLLSQYFAIPLFHSPEQRVARWKYINHPATLSLYGVQFPTWWDERARK
jgi:peptide/nickel transport system substrate-binding protein